MVAGSGAVSDNYGSGDGAAGYNGLGDGGRGTGGAGDGGLGGERRNGGWNEGGRHRSHNCGSVEA